MEPAYDVLHSLVAARDARRQAFTFERDVFDRVVREVEGHPDLVVLNAFIAPPAGAAQLAAAEKKLGQKLPGDLRAFYSECNGLSLVWADRKESAFRLAPKRKDQLLNKPARFDHAGGRVAIPAIEQLVATIDQPLSAGWTRLDRKLPTRKELSAAAAVFDHLDVARAIWLVVAEDGVELCLGQERLNFQYAPRVDLASYLDLTFALRGAHDRFRLFGGSLRDARAAKPELDFAGLSLEQVLSAVRQDVHYQGTVEQVGDRFQAAREQFLEGKHAQAAMGLQAVLQEDPLHVEAAWLRVQSLAALKKKVDAAREAERVPTGAVGARDDQYHGAVALLEAGVTDAATRAIVSCLSCWPAFADGWYLLGRLLAPRPEALPCLRHAKALGAEDPALDQAIAALA